MTLQKSKRTSRHRLRVIILTLLITLSVCFCGCTAQGLQVNERAFVQLFGLYKEGGNYHAEIALPEGETVSGTGESILSAVADAERGQGKKLFLGQMKLFVLGGGLTDLPRDLNVFLSGDICPACPVIFADDPASIAQSGMEAEDILASLNVYASQGLAVVTPLTELAATSVGTDTAAAVPKAEADGGTVRFSDIVLIGGGKNITISDTDALGIKLLCGGLELSDKVAITTMADGAVVSGEIIGAKTKWNLSSEDGVITAEVTLKIKADVTEKPADMKDLTAQQTLEDAVAEAMIKTYDTIARQYKTDAFGISKRVRKDLPRTYKNYEKSPSDFLAKSILKVNISGR